MNQKFAEFICMNQYQFIMYNRRWNIQSFDNVIVIINQVNTTELNKPILGLETFMKDFIKSGSGINDDILIEFRELHPEYFI